MVSEVTKENIFITRNIVAAFFTFFHNGLYFYWGNMSIYVISYYVHYRDSLDESEIRPGLALTFYAAGWMAAMLASGPLATLINVRLLICISIIILNSSFFVTYFASFGSMITFFITFGLLVGLGTGLYEGPLLQYYVVNLSKKHSGLLTALALAGGPTGGVIINQFATWYVNPKNLSPNLSVGSMLVFTEVEILKRIPPLLIILGISITIVQLIGLVLVQYVAPPKSTDDTKSTHAHVSYNSTHSNTSQDISERNVSEVERSVPFEKNSNVPLLGIHQYTPKELIRSKSFYTLFGVYSLGISARVVLSTYYKVYGQEWIADDHFLTYLGTAQTLCLIPSNIGYGFLMDSIGVKRTLMMMYSGIAIFDLLMYFSAQWNEWAYVAATLCAALLTNLYTCFNIATLKWFGSKYLATNVAIVECSASIGYVVSTTLIDPLIAIYGHFTEWAWASTACVIGLIIITTLLPRQ